MTDGTTATPAGPPLGEAVLAHIREAARVRGYSNNELARRTGLNPGTVSRIMSGTYRLTIPTVERFANALNLKPDQLITGNLEHSCTGH